MSFDLRMQLLGLGMYVPEGDARMHVLLPRHGVPPAAESMETLRGGVAGAEHDPHHGNGVPVPQQGPAPGTMVLPDPQQHQHPDADRHFPRLMYDIAYEKPNQTRLARRYRMIDLEGRVLDLTGLPTSEELEVRLPHELPSMDAVAGPVPRDLVQQLPGTRLAGRVTLESGAFTRSALGAAFFLNDREKASRMAWDTEWTVRGISSVLDDDRGELEYLPPLLVRGPAEKQRRWLPTLFPIGKTIHLTVFNAIREAFPPKGEGFHIEKPEAPTDHFQAYYTVCAPGIAGGPLPVPAETMFVDVEGDGVDEGGDLHLPGVICVQVQASLAPA